MGTGSWVVTFHVKRPSRIADETLSRSPYRPLARILPPCSLLLMRMIRRGQNPGLEPEDAESRRALLVVRQR